MVRIRNLRKSYGSYQALRGLTMEIDKGELFGFVGPNGAGKTTTMKIIAGLMRADSGEVMVAWSTLSGYTGQVREIIGYVPDFFGVYDDLKVQEYLEFFASLYGMDSPVPSISIFPVPLLFFRTISHNRNLPMASRA